jgi:hypothetical protein
MEVGVAMKKTVALASLLFLSAMAQAADPPARKEGLWQRHNVQTENPGNKQDEYTQMTCRNHEFDQYEQALVKELMSRTTCTVTESEKGNAYQSNQVCHVAGTTIDRKETTTYLGDAAIHFESHATLTPAMAGVTERTLVADEKYLGACPAQLQPGDMTSADGKIHHLWRH